jgi:hypothetical protein
VVSKRDAITVAGPMGYPSVPDRQHTRVWKVGLSTASGIARHGATGASQSEKLRFVCGNVGRIWASFAKPPLAPVFSDEAKW